MSIVGAPGKGGNPVPLRYVTLCCVAFSCVACSGPCAILLPGTSCACAVVDILYTIISNTHQHTHTITHTHAREMLINLLIVRRCFSPFLSLILTLVWRYFDLCVCVRVATLCFILLLRFRTAACPPFPLSLAAPFDCSSCDNVLVTP